MQALKRELLLCLTISALVFTSALAWGSPFTTTATPAQTVAVSANSQQQMPNNSQPQGTQQQQTTKTFTGVVVKSGSSYDLQSTSGEIYKLTGAPNAGSYVGQTVTVKGRLNKQSKSIQVSSIQPQ